jgi:hypothetical protein
MAIDPAVITAAVEIGVKLYEFIDKLSNKGQKGDPLTPVMNQLHAIRNNINSMGEQLRKAIDGAVDTIVGDIRLTQLAQLPDAHAAVAAYLRTHANSTQTTPVLNDPNYVAARGKSSDVMHYFLGHNELAFMGGFIYAMNTRIEFIVGLDVCWFQNNPSYVTEIRNGVNHLNGYISRIKSGIDRQFRVNEKENIVFETPEEPPFTKPVRIVESVTFTVSGPTGSLWSRTVPPTQRSATRNAANSVRNQHAGAMKSQVMGPYDQIAATWNALVANHAAASIQSNLLPRSEANALTLNTTGLEVTALREIAPAATLRALSNDDDAGEALEVRFEVPLREVLIQVLESPEFHQRQERTLRGKDQRGSAFWVEKAFQREPTPEEAETLQNVLKLFGYKSFFHCLVYSREYEERWGSGVPVAATLETVEA